MRNNKIKSNTIDIFYNLKKAQVEHESTLPPNREGPELQVNCYYCGNSVEEDDAVEESIQVPYTPPANEIPGVEEFVTGKLNTMIIPAFGKFSDRTIAEFCYGNEERGMLPMVGPEKSILRGQINIVIPDIETLVSAYGFDPKDATNSTDALAQAIVSDPSIIYNLLMQTPGLVYTDKPIMVDRPVLVCDECEGTEKCSNCDERVKSDQMYEDGKDKYCQDCMDEYFSVCEKCNNLVDNDNIVAVNGGDEKWDRQKGKYWSEQEFMCNECAKAFCCDDCSEYNLNVERHNLDGYVRDICQECLMENYFSCEECGHLASKDEMNNVGEEVICNDCMEKSPNAKSFAEISHAANNGYGINPQNDPSYFQQQYSGLYQMPEGVSNKKQKQWNYVKNWFGDFSYIPKLSAEVTKPSTGYEGTYIEFHNQDPQGLANAVGKDPRELNKIMETYNSQHACLVSGDPSRMIVMRVLVDDDDDWHVKLMQGSVNQEAKRESMAPADAAKMYQELQTKRNEASNLYDKIYRQFQHQKSELFQDYAARIPRRRITEDQWHEYSRLNIELQEADKQYTTVSRSMENMQKVVADPVTAKKITNATNGAYVAAYDWIARLAESQGKNLFVEIPEAQEADAEHDVISSTIAQFGNAPKISLEMIYGALPFLMGFNTEKAEGKQRTHQLKRKKKEAMRKRAMIKVAMWDLPELSKIGAEFDDEEVIKPKEKSVVAKYYVGRRVL